MEWRPPSDSISFRFDSRLDEEFFAAFTPGGPLRPLVEYAFSNYPVDLHFRRDWVSGSQHATLFVGLNRLVDIEFRQGRIRLHPMRALREGFDFDETWGAWAPLVTTWPGQWENFLDRAIPWASDGRGAMGAGIAPASHSGRRARWSISQGFAVQFRHDTLRKTMFSGVTADLRSALVPNPIAATPNPLKLETSVLYVNSEGDLLITEVQSRRASELPWAAGITIANMRLLKLWLAHDPEAYEILAESIRTRTLLGLLPATTALPHPGSRVIPVIQSQMGISPRLRNNIGLVWERFVERGIPEARDLELLEWSISGREQITANRGEHSLHAQFGPLAAG